MYAFSLTDHFHFILYGLIFLVSIPFSNGAEIRGVGILEQIVRSNSLRIAIPKPDIQRLVQKPSPSGNHAENLSELSLKILGKINHLAEFPLEEQKSPDRIIRFQPWELVTALAWSPDGKFLAVAAGNQIYLILVEKWQIIDQVEIGALSTELTFNPMGNLLASSGRDGILRVWRVSQVSQQGNSQLLTPVWEVSAHRKGVNALAFSPDGKVIASGGNDAMVRVWEVESGEKLSEVIGGSYSVPSIKFSPDGQTLAVVNGNFIRLRDLESGRILGSFRAQESLYCIDYDPEGDYLAVGSSENHLYLWKLDDAFRTGSEAYSVPQTLANHQGKAGAPTTLVWEILYSPDGNLLVSAGGDGRIKVVNIKDHNQVREIDAHLLGVTSLAFSPNGQQLASGGLDGAVRIWSLDQLR